LKAESKVQVRIRVRSSQPSFARLKRESKFGFCSRTPLLKDDAIGNLAADRPRWVSQPIRPLEQRKACRLTAAARRAMEESPRESGIHATPSVNENIAMAMTAAISIRAPSAHTIAHDADTLTHAYSGALRRTSMLQQVLNNFEYELMPTEGRDNERNWKYRASKFSCGENVPISLSNLADQVGGCTAALMPFVQAPWGLRAECRPIAGWRF
jgi:hypothetical protein